jgi:tetratricopeptide (TPR) repeat protein
MRRRWLFLSLVFTIVRLSTIYAQTDDWATGCDTDALPAIAATTSQLNYAAACEMYNSCLGDADASICQMRVLLDLESRCTNDLCRIRARLYASAILLPDISYANPFTLENSSDLPPILLSALTHFESGNYAAAVADYQSITTDISYHPLVSISAGLAAEAEGDADQARATYDRTMAQIVADPFAFYVRGSFFSRMGFAEEAAADFANLLNLASDPEMVILTEELAKTYPVEQIPFEQWMAYPVYFEGGSLDGNWASDESQLEAYPIEIAIVSSGERLITRGLGRLFDKPPLYLNLAAQFGGIYYFQPGFVYDFDDWTASISLNLATQPVVITEEGFGYESGASASYLIAPDDQPDPRVSFETLRLCPNGVISRLTIGDEASWGIADYPSVGWTIFDAPKGNPIGEFDWKIRVVGGPECIDDQAWWRVESTTDDALNGWVPENDGNSYLLLNANPPPIPEMAAQP